ncbi:MAG: hypothetical protein II934_06035 [Prevotella sp.]|nr:hypothetical protein [Prevotella sp.]
MKKIKLLSIVCLLSATAFAADYTGIQLTFQRTGTNASSVTVNVKDQDGNAINGVTATLISTSFGTLMEGTAQALTNGTVLAPASNSSYSNGANAEISYLFRINGLDPSFTYNKADIDVYAMNSGGTAQGNKGDTKRNFQFSVSTGSSENAVSLFAEKTEDTDICTVTDQSGGLYHSVQTMMASVAKTATTPLYVRITLKKTSSLGCYAGIGFVKLYSEVKYSGIQLTFNRMGTNASSVITSVSDQDGNALNGVTATLVSTSFGNLKIGSADALSNGSVLAPNTYSNQPGSEITYLFKVTGLDYSFYFNKADIDVYAMNANGGAQSNSGNTKRNFQFFISTGSTASVSAFASKEIDTDICTVADQNGGLYHSIQTMTATSMQTATGPLYIQVTLKKTADLGCYAGIGLVKLYSERQDSNINPAPSVYHAFSKDKTYTIRCYHNNSAFVYQSGNQMGTGNFDTSKMSWWVLVPTDKDDCYYIKNATTGKYVQSSKGVAQNVAVAMGDTPVEFEIKKDETNGAATKGYYYMASTDNDPISIVGDVTKGLNWSVDYACVVTWWIKTGRKNSYWDIVEDEYRYAPNTIDVSDYSRQVQMYSMPCGTTGKAYLKKVDIAGDDILGELHYSVTSKPSKAHVVYTDQKAEVKQGGTLPLTVTLANSNANVRTFAYADWDKDGVFEVSQEITGSSTTFNVPADAEMGQSRLRIRVTETDTDGAEDDVIGYCYDFLVNVVSGDAKIEWTVEVNDKTRGTVTAEEVGGNLRASVTLYGDAKFKGWKLMHSYFKGEMVGTSTEIELPLTQSIRLVAILSPNTKDVPSGIMMVPSDIAAIAERESEADNAIYNLQGIKMDGKNLPKGIYIVNHKKKIIK